MSTKLSFREALERRGETRASHPAVSASQDKTTIALFAARPIDKPVDFIRLLKSSGVSMKRARAVLDRLAQRAIVPVTVNADGMNFLFEEMDRLGVTACALKNQPVDPKAIRERLDLSQPDFASLYGLEVDTVRNWEQNRYTPDGPAQTLLNIIDLYPEVVVWARAAAHFRKFADGMGRHRFFDLTTIYEGFRRAYPVAVSETKLSIGITGDISNLAHTQGIMWKVSSSAKKAHVE